MIPNDTPFIPPKTAELLSEVQTPGNRHDAALKIAMSLIGNGLTPDAVFAQLRAKFDPEKTDKELRGIIAFAVSKNPTPSGFGEPRTKWNPPPMRALTPKKRSPIEHAGWWLNGQTISMENFIGQSEIAVPNEPAKQLRAVLELLYNGAENLNIVRSHDMQGEKARPKGPGRILSRDKWLEYLVSKGVPSSDAGAWFRPNPVRPQGSGAAGAVTDSDVERFRFLLVESDVLPLDAQLALFSKLRLPIAAVVSSGGVSAHAWLRLDAKDATEYEAKARRILTALAPFGIDQANKNPSRLSRLPGAVRKIGAANGGEQKLLWLCPGKKALTDSELDAFENSLQVPSIEEKPFKRLIEEAIPRYEYMMANIGKLGVPTGIPSFDRITGGLKPGGYTLIAAATGAGKSTLGLNMINAALEYGTGVVLFSLEMSREDIVDMMFSLNCSVNRNKFNTGEFTAEDTQRMAEGTLWMKELPLWVDDTPDITVEGIRRCVLSLCAENRIGLVVVDYAQLALLDIKPESREQAVGAVALGLRVLSREANVPVLLLSQLNDEGKVRESRKLAHEASTVLLLTRKDGDLTNPEMTLSVAKGRKIPARPFQLTLQAECCRITERSPIQESDMPTRTPYAE